MSSGGKILNLRLPFALALSLAGGIIFAYALSYYNVQSYLYFTAVPVAAVIFVLAAIVCKNKYTLIGCFACIVFFLAGNAYCVAKLYTYEQSEVTLNTLCGVSGSVDGVYQTQSGTTYIIVSNAYADGVKLEGKVLAYLGDKAGEYCDAGDKVTFPCTLDKYDAFTYGELNYRTEQGVKYKCTIYGGLEAEDKFNLFACVRSGIYATLFNNLSEETAAVSFAMLTGDTTAMNENTLSSFRYGGIAHIFAVSGLHMGVLYGVLSIILKRLRANKYLSAGLKIGILVFYAGVCGFTPSSVRALIMCSVAAIAKLFHQKYDSLNALSLSVIILLLVNPLYLFGAGFILSVSAVLGIIFISPRFQRLFNKLPARFAESLSVGLSAQVATFPALLLTFGYVSGAGLLLNILVLPVLSALYIIIFCSTLFCSIIPAVASAVMPAVCIPLDFVINLAVSAGLENSIISGFGGGWLALVLIVAVLAVTDKINIKLSLRLITAIATAVAFTFMVVADGVVPSNTLKITASAYYGGGMVIIRSSEGTTVVITEDLYTGRVFSELSKNCVSGADAVIILGGDECLQEYYDLNMSIPDIYLSPKLISVDAAGESTVHYMSNFTLLGVDYTLVDSYTLSVEYDGASLAICAGQYINIGKANLLISLQENLDCDAERVVYFNRIDGIYGQCNIYDCGDLHFTVKDGKIINSQIIPNAR
jgi:ComEC/Rec2-related protein